MSSCDRCAATGPQGAAVSLEAGRLALSSPCRVLREIDSLHAVSSALTFGNDFQGAIHSLFEKLQVALGLHSGMLAIVDRENGRLSLDAVGAPLPLPDKPLTVPLEAGFLGQAVQLGDPLVLDDITKEPRDRLSPLDLWQIRDSEKQSFAWLAVPIRHGAEVLGVLSFLCPAASRNLLQGEARFLTLIAGQVGLAVRFRQLAKERFESLQHENERLQDQIKKSFVPDGMIGRSSAMRMVYFHVDQVASSKTTVLIRGETGSGKERIAQSIWQAGNRQKKPFVRVNCAALPESIIESELFGHEKGAFTGALSLRKGRFELAHGGTLFLDEIGEISAATQAKLLRILQEGTFERVGGSETLKVDVRIIAATNRNLEEMTESGKFRLDLYYRLNVFPIYIPPLRERKSDMIELADHFLEKYNGQTGKKVARISTPAIDMLMAYHWPGNVRELENIIERAVILSNDGVIHGYHLPPSLQTGEATNTSSQRTLQETLNAVEKEMIIEALKSHRGIMAKAARQLGLTERIMGLRVKAHDIEPKRFRDGEQP